MPEKIKAPFNRTLEVTADEEIILSNQLLTLRQKVTSKEVINKIIHQDLFDAINFLPDNIIDLLFIDPPYNINKKFNSSSFNEMDEDLYVEYIDSWLSRLVRLVKPTGSVYICCDWKSSSAVYYTAKKYFKVRNRITWEREKGRGAKANWKNCSEDIWYFTKGEDYTFNIEDVMLKRRVLAPYKDISGNPKDWSKEGSESFRITHPSNIWSDITVPFWSMPENTNHPTQKPEKLLAKIILASSKEGDLVFDPFAGSGTTAVTAKKLKRNYLIVEKDHHYCCLAQKRLNLAQENKSIQGFDGSVFWERNSLKK